MGPTRSNETRPTFLFPRLRAALALREISLDGLGRRLGVSGRHLAFVCANERRASARLLAALESELGAPAWRFVTGQDDHLLDEGRQ
jgi:transcriptional regulator with XRE-family HTH domain